MCVCYPYFATPFLWSNKLLWQEMKFCYVKSILYIPEEARIIAQVT